MTPFNIRIETIASELIKTAKRYQTTIPRLLQNEYFSRYQYLESEIIREARSQQLELEMTLLDIYRLESEAA